MDSLLQVLTNGIIAGSLYTLIALGLSLTYGILMFINFAHADMAMLGAYFFLIGERMGWPLPLCAAAAIVAVGFIGVILERLTFKPIRNAPAVKPMLVSIGMNIALQSLAFMAFGSSLQSYNKKWVTTISFFDDKILITNIQLFALVASIVLTTALLLYLKYSKMGKAIRAVADSTEVSAILGIQPDTVIRRIFFIGSALAAVAGIFIGYNQSLIPVMGSVLIVKAFTAILIGGLGNIHGTILGGFTIGILENLAIGITPLPANYKDAVTFALLILILLFRPQGVFGQKIESKSVT